MLRVLFRRALLLPLGSPPKPYRALPLRILDLAELEAAAAGLWLDPADDWPDAPAEADWPMLRALVDRAAEGPPEWAEPRALDFAFGTGSGQAMIVEATLRDDPVTPKKLAAVMPTVTARQLERLMHVAFGIDPGRATADRLDAHLGVRRRVIDAWELASEQIAKLAKARDCLPWDLREVTLPELAILANGGRRADPFAGEYDHDASRRQAEFWAATERRGPGPTPNGAAAPHL